MLKEVENPTLEVTKKIRPENTSNDSNFENPFRMDVSPERLDDVKQNLENIKKRIVLLMKEMPNENIKELEIFRSFHEAKLAEKGGNLDKNFILGKISILNEIDKLIIEERKLEIECEIIIENSKQNIPVENSHINPKKQTIEEQRKKVLDSYEDTDPVNPDSTIQNKISETPPKKTPLNPMLVGTTNEIKENNNPQNNAPDQIRNSATENETPKTKKEREKREFFKKTKEKFLNKGKEMIEIISHPSIILNPLIDQTVALKNNILNFINETIEEAKNTKRELTNEIKTIISWLQNRFSKENSKIAEKITKFVEKPEKKIENLKRTFNFSEEEKTGNVKIEIYGTKGYTECTVKIFKSNDIKKNAIEQTIVKIAKGNAIEKKDLEETGWVVDVLVIEKSQTDSEKSIPTKIKNDPTLSPKAFENEDEALLYAEFMHKKLLKIKKVEEEFLKNTIEEKNKEIWEKILKGDFSDLEDMTEICYEISKILAEKYSDPKLYLFELKTMDEHSAEMLSEFKGSIWLHKLDLTERIAKKLGKSKSEKLVLNGKNLSPEIAKCFKNYGGKELHFKNLENISPDLAKEFADFNAKEINIYDAVSISDESIMQLAKFKGKIIANKEIEEKIQKAREELQITIEENKTGFGLHVGNAPDINTVNNIKN